MEKLSIQHLAARLSCGLKVIDNRNQSIKEVSFDIVHGDDIINVGTLLKVNSHFSLKGPYLPILRPLSDITKPIIHKGETFVPIEYFLGEDPDIILNAVQINDLSWIPYNLVQKLLEWHIDIGDLIGKGLAIDVSSLTVNPYQDK